MKKLVKKLVKVMLILTFLGCLAYMIYVHRNVIKAIITGGEMPELPKGHCHGKCSNERD